MIKHCATSRLAKDECELLNSKQKHIPDSAALQPSLCFRDGRQFPHSLEAAIWKKHIRLLLQSRIPEKPMLDETSGDHLVQPLVESRSLD